MSQKKIEKRSKIEFGFKFLIVAAFFILAAPAYVDADIAHFVFTTEPQTINPGELSGAITIQTQNVNGEKTNTTETIDLEFSSTSSTGEFLNASGNPVSTVMAKNTANRTFYYRDATAGIYTLKVKATGRDSRETWEVTQNITVGTTSSAPASSGSETASAPNTGWAEEPEKKFKAVINSASSGIAGADLVFEGRVYAESGTEVSAERYFWNFGDGGSANGKKLLHAFFFPGKYQVSFTASVNGKSAAAYKEIEILENKLAISEVRGGENSWIKLSNSASQKLHLSRWMLRSGGETFIFPEETYILPKAVLTLAEATTGLKFSASGEAELLYPNGTLAQRFSYPLALPSPPPAPKPEVKPASPSSILPTSTTSSVLAQPPEFETAQAASPFLSRTFYSWGIGVLGLGLLAALGFLASRRPQ